MCPEDHRSLQGTLKVYRSACAVSCISGGSEGARWNRDTLPQTVVITIDAQRGSKGPQNAV